MRPVRADFTPRSPWPDRIAIGFAVVALVFAAVQVHLGLGEQRKALALEEQVRALGDEAAARQPKPVPKAPEPPYAQDAAAIVRAASYDYGAVLTALETVRMPSIRVTSIEIVTAEAAARVELEFTDPAVLLPYLEELNLGRPDHMGKWRIVRAQMPSSTPGVATLAAPADLAGELPAHGVVSRR